MLIVGVMKTSWRSLPLLLATTAFLTGCIPVVRTSVVHYGVQCTLVDADSGLAVSKQRVQVTVDSREYEKRTDPRGGLKVHPERRHYWAWLMGGPFYVNPTRANIAIAPEDYALYQRESVVVPEALDAPAPDQDKLSAGYINLGTVLIRKRQPAGAADRSQPVSRVVTRASGAAGSGR
jgi:hypothetical protein